ncbi:unnamed protein product [Caretta caretta]
MAELAGQNAKLFQRCSVQPLPKRRDGTEPCSTPYKRALKPGEQLPNISLWSLSKEPLKHDFILSNRICRKAEWPPSNPDKEGPLLTTTMLLNLEKS